MEKVVLQTNLRFLLEGMTEAETGRLFLALLAEKSEGLSEKAQGVYQYILSLQCELAEKQQKMRLLGAKGGAESKKRVKAKMNDLFGDVEATLTDAQATLTDAQATLTKRKVTKENNINKIKKIFISSDFEKAKEETNVPPVKPFVPPSVDEVKEFVNAEGLKVVPEVFVDFYESHGWCVGKTPIKNWRATVRLWHRRAQPAGKNLSPSEAKGNAKCIDTATKPESHVPKNEDEAYWHELMERVEQKETKSKVGVVGGNAPVCNEDKALKSARREEVLSPKETGTDESPFARFMRRIEDNDLLREEPK